MVNGGQRPDFGGQRSDSLQIYILGISIPNARCMQNLGSFRPLGQMDLTFGPDGAFGMDMHVLEAWTPNRVIEQNLMEDSF